MINAESLGLNSQQIFEIARQARLELARRYAKEKNILGWGQVLFPEKFSLPFCTELHQYFVDIRNLERTNTEAPRNHAKTTIKCFLIPLFQALEEPETFRHYLNVQATESKAYDINRSIRIEIEENELLRELYGNQVGDRWSEAQFVLKNGVIFTAIGAGQSIRGLNYRNTRPDYTIVDDLYDEEDINNPESTQKKNRWFWGSLYLARAKSKNCSIHFQGTAINNEDLLEKLKKKERWKSATFKAIKDFEKKIVLWQELNTFDSLMSDKEDMGTIIFMREMQNERRDDETSIIKSPWIKEYDPDQLEFKLRDGKEFFITRIIVGNDPSIGKKKENDKTGTAVVIETKYKDGGHDYWIEQLLNDQISLEGRIAQLLQISKSREKGRELNEVRIEAIAGFNDYADEVIRRTELPIKRINFVKDKISTLISKSHYFENGKVHLNKRIDQKMKDEFINQMTTNYPKHDDIRDAVLLCLDKNEAVASASIF